MSEQTSERVLTERRGPILIVTVNRPEARNAFDDESSHAMNAAMDMLDAEDELFIGIITGAGGNFSAGADLKAAAARGNGPREGPTALAASKEIMWQSADWTDEEGWSKQMPIAQKALDSEDRQEGLQVFAEKRKPVWKGR